MTTLEQLEDHFGTKTLRGIERSFWKEGRSREVSIERPTQYKC